MIQVNDILTDDEILAQLAEECTEMAQAALKLRRAITGVNYTPKQIIECRMNLTEEYADVCTCLDALQWDDKLLCTQISHEKNERWARRLLEHPHPLHKNYESQE